MSQVKNTIFIKLMKKDGNVIGHAVSSDKAFPANEEDSAPPTALSDLDEELIEAIQSFYASMIIYLDFIPAVLDLVPAISSEAIILAIEAFLEKEKVSKEELPDGIVFEVTSDSYSEFSKLAGIVEPTFDVQSTLAKNVLMGMVAVLDSHIMTLLRIVCRYRPEAVFASSETVLVKDVIASGNIEDFKELLIGNEVEKISWVSLSDQMDWFQKKLNLDPISKNYKNWKLLGEVVQRRHLFAHTSGRVSTQYVNNSKEYGYDVKDVIIGSKLGVGSDYFKEAVSCVFEFGIMLAHVIRRKTSENKDDEADSALNQLAFNLLQRGDYTLARRLLEFANSMRGKASDRTKRMITVNYANALRLSGSKKESTELLDGWDWSSVSEDFGICVAAVRGDLDAVEKLMKEFGSNRTMRESYYREWPVFFHVRDDLRFLTAYEEVFGIPFRPSPKRRNSMSEIFANISAQKNGQKNLATISIVRQEKPPEPGS